MTQSATHPLRGGWEEPADGDESFRGRHVVETGHPRSPSQAAAFRLEDVAKNLFKRHLSRRLEELLEISVLRVHRRLCYSEERSLE